MIFQYKHTGWFYILQGVIILCIGVLILLNPDTTLVTLTRILGGILLIAGLLLVFTSWGMNDRTKNLMRFEGVVNIGFGLVFVFFPSLLAGAFIVILGIFAFLSGLINLWMLVRIRAKLISASFIRNSLLLLFGLFMLFNPIKGQETIGIIIGAFAIAFGIMSLYNAYRLFVNKKSNFE